jgi:hypothetical protein
MSKDILKIIFGRDQVIGIDNVLAEMQAEGKVIEIQKEVLVNHMVGYTITFDKIFDAYLFGHRSADLLAYSFGVKRKLP